MSGWFCWIACAGGKERGETVSVAVRRAAELFFLVFLEGGGVESRKGGGGGVYADLLELVLLRCFVLARFGGLPVQLLCCELDSCRKDFSQPCGLAPEADWRRKHSQSPRTFRLNKLFSRPLMMRVG